MPDPGVGFEYPRTEVSWLKRDVLLFAVSIGADAKDELHFIYVCMLPNGKEDYEYVLMCFFFHRNCTPSLLFSLPTRSSSVSAPKESV